MSQSRWHYRRTARRGAGLQRERIDQGPIHYFEPHHVSFRLAGRGTQLELRHEGYLDFEDQPTHEQGWRGALDKLAAILNEEATS